MNANTNISYNHPPEGGVKQNTMKTLKLEVGKTYRNRKGEEVKITGCDGGYYQPYKGTNGEWYTEGGKWQSSPEESPKDLIEEVEEAPETRYTFTIPEGAKKVTVEQVGNCIASDIAAIEYARNRGMLAEVLIPMQCKMSEQNTKMTENEPTVIGAMNGWGNGISKDEITITEK